MSTLMQASNEWFRRPVDERFLSLSEMHAFCADSKARSVAKVMANRELSVAPVEGESRGLAVVGPNGQPVLPTNWSFGQLAQRAGAPAKYMRDLPPAIASDCINWGIARRDVEELGVFLQRDREGNNRISAVTGPNYGRIWNADVLAAIVERFGNGVDGDFRVPGEFGKRVDVTRENTTLYASDRDMFVFLADEENRIEVPNRRNGESGQMARGFFVWNSEVGSTTLGFAHFLFDFVCMNRIVWGATQYDEVRVRHSSGAPHRWVEEIAPAIESYRTSSTEGITTLIAAAKEKRIGTADDVDTFLAKRFTKGQAKAIQAAHLNDEARPIETLWDAATGVTAYARGVQYQDRRVSLEREGGKILNLAA